MNDTPDTAVRRRPSRYPSAVAGRPAAGSGDAVEIAEGVFWLRMPVPNDLEAVNVWLLADGDGWTIVDTGMKLSETAVGWRAAMAGVMKGRPITRVVVTHLHPDHSGMAGWLCDKSGAPLHMSSLEYLTLRVMASDQGEPPPEAIAFYRACGWDEAALDEYRASFGRFGKAVYALPPVFRALRDHDVLTIGDRQWQVVIGSGHSPEHVSLYCEEEGLLISGDQILPDISSNVSVHPQQPDSDPLTDWLETLAMLRDRVPADVVVLPSHGDPFRGLHQRIGELIDGHEQGLRKLLDALDMPKRATDLFAVLFRREITSGLLFLATGESLAHLACLRTRGQIDTWLDAEGIRWWRRADG